MSKTNKITKLSRHNIIHSVIGLSLLLSLNAVSSEQDSFTSGNGDLVTVSVGMKKVLTPSLEDKNYRQGNILLTKDKSLALIGAESITRESKAQAKHNKTQKLTALKSKAQQTLKTSNYHHSFSIYNAESYLLDDYDGDGYYQTFSVVFDADLHSIYADDSAEVYADMYLSKNGGPWIYYYTTESFVIEGDSELDEYEVITTLHQGYDTDTYDVLIDLYELGYEDLVASYSSDDNNALYALPLESAEVDVEYVVEVYDDYAGSMSVLGLFLVLITLRVRLKNSH